MDDLRKFFDGSLMISSQLANNLEKCFLVPLRLYKHPQERSLIFSCDREHFSSVAGARPFVYLDQRFLSPLKNRIITKLSADKWWNPAEEVIPQPVNSSRRANKSTSWPLACANLECLLRCKKCNIMESDRPVSSMSVCATPIAQTICVTRYYASP